MRIECFCRSQTQKNFGYVPARMLADGVWDGHKSYLIDHFSDKTNVYSIQHLGVLYYFTLYVKHIHLLARESTFWIALVEYLCLLFST